MHDEEPPRRAAGQREDVSDADVRVRSTAIDVLAGCPAPTVNRNDGGASIAKLQTSGGCHRFGRRGG